MNQPEVMSVWFIPLLLDSVQCAAGRVPPRMAGLSSFLASGLSVPNRGCGNRGAEGCGELSNMKAKT